MLSCLEPLTALGQLPSLTNISHNCWHQHLDLSVFLAGEKAVAMENLGEPGDWQLVGEGRAHAVFAYKGMVLRPESCLVRCM